MSLKKLTAVLLALCLLVSTGIMMPVSAVDVTLDAGYALLDTCYSPSLGMYVALAKKLGGDVTPGTLLYSETGEEWKVSRKLNSATHYANKQTQQNLLWWEKEQMFVLQCDSHIMTSTDGIEWKIEDETLKGVANSTITTLNDQLVVAARRSLRVYDDKNTKTIDVEIMPGVNDYSKAIGVTNQAPYTYALIDKAVCYIISKKEAETETAEETFAEGTLEEEALEEDALEEGNAVEPVQEVVLTEKIETADSKENYNVLTVPLGATFSKVPYDVEYIAPLKGWITIDGALLTYLGEDGKTITSVGSISLTDGATAAENFSAVSQNSELVILGTKSGNLYVAPKNDRILESGCNLWTRLIPGEMTSSVTQAINSISMVDENSFFFVTDDGMYLACKEGKGWKYYDPANSKLSAGAVKRIEIPESGNVTEDIIPTSTTWNEKASINTISSLTVSNSLPDGVTTESVAGGAGMAVTVDSSVQGGHQIDMTATAKNGQKLDFTVDIVDFERLDVQGYEAMALPKPGAGAKEYRYTPAVIGTDGLPMETRKATMEVKSMPEGVSFNANTGTFTVQENAKAGKVVLHIYAGEIGAEMTVKEIPLCESYPAQVVFRVPESEIIIPSQESIAVEYKAGVFDQVEIIMPEESLVWSVEAVDIPTIDGVSINSKGILNVNSFAYAGKIEIKAAVESNPEIFQTTEVQLNYTDQRKAMEDLRTVGIKDGAILESGLNLPKTGTVYESAMSWLSSDETMLKPDGTLIRPSRADAQVSLTGTAVKNGQIAKQTYTFTVKKAENLCTNGDFSLGNTSGWEIKNNTTVALQDEQGKKVLQVSGGGVYRTMTLNNDSSYAFELTAKAEKGDIIKLRSVEGGLLAEIEGNGEYRTVKSVYHYRKQKPSFEEKIYVECDGLIMWVSELKVYEISIELEKVSAAVERAEYTKKKEDIETARKLLKDFYDLPVKEELLDRLDAIVTGDSGNSKPGGGNRPSGGGGGGGGGGGSSSGSGSSVVAPPVQQEDNYADELDIYLLNFKDMKGHWAREDVEYMANLKLINGTAEGVFSPDESISRAEFAALIVRTMGLQASEYENSFFDVIAEDWFSGEVQTVKNNRFMNGYDGFFRPNDPITREEIAKVIVEAYNSKSGETAGKGEALYFSDLEDISFWAYDYIVEAVELGFMNGVSEEVFSPKTLATRAQAAVMLRRVYDKLNPGNAAESTGESAGE